MQLEDISAAAAGMARPDADPDFDVVYAIRPHSAMMWRLADYDASQRRWSR